MKLNEAMRIFKLKQIAKKKKQNRKNRKKNRKNIDKMFDIRRDIKFITRNRIGLNILLLLKPT